MTETLNFIDRDSVEEVNPERDDQYRIVLEAMRVGIIFSDESGHFWVFNSEMEKLTGYSMGEANACSDFTLLLHPDLKDCEQVLDGLNNLVKPGDIYETKTIICTKNGTYRTVFVSTTLILYKGHRMFLSTYYDITGSEQVEEALLESEEKYRSMINDVLDASQTGIFVLDSEFKVVWINHSIEKYFGFKKENIIGKDKRQLIESSIKDIFEDPDTFREEVFATYDNNTYIENFECHVLLDGKRRERWLEHRSQPIKLGLYKGGRVEYYTDITERKHIEEELAKVAAEQKNIMETVSDGVYMLDLKGNLVSWNREVDEVTGLSAEELMDKPIVEFFAEEDRAAVAEAIRKGLEEGIGEVTGSFLRKDRPPAIYQWSVVPLKDPQGNVIGLTGVGRDITERKHIEEALAKVAAEQKNIMETVSDGVYMLDMNGNLVSWNREVDEVTGLSAEELMDKPIVEFFAEEDRAAVAEAITKGLEEGTGEVTGSFLRKDRPPAIYQWSVVPLKDPQGNVIGLTGVGRDITERKHIEEALAKVAAEQKNIMETVSDGVYMLDMNGNLVSWNREVDEVTGLSAEELMDKPIVEFFAEEDRAAVAEAITKGLEEGTGEVTGSFLRKDRPPAIYQWSVVPLKDPQGNVIGLTGVGRDITERKHIEEALAKVAAEQKNIMETVSDGVYMLDMNGNLVSWNREVDEVTGLSAEELMDKPIVEFFAEEDRAAVAEAITKGLEEGTGEVTGSFLRKDRPPAIYQWSVVPLKDPQGNVIGLTGVGRDITERKHIEEALAKVAAEQKNIMETVSDGVYMLDMNGNLVSWNREVDEVTGLSAEELMDKPIVEFFAEEDRAAVAEAITKGLEEGTGEVTGSFLRKDRPPAIYQWSVVPLKDPQGNVIGLTGVGRDITERKHIEEALAKVAAEQKNIMETVSDGVYMLDMNGNLVSWNREVDEVTGLSAEELMDKPIVEFFAEEDRAAVAEAITKGLEEGTGEVTGSFLRKDRPPAIYQWSVVPLKDPQGNVIGLTGVGRDITERKHIEEALAKVAAEQKNIMETVSDGVYMLDMNGNLVSWNREVDEVTGLSAEELMDKPIVEFFAEEDRAAVAEAITKGLEEGTGEVTGSFLRKDRPPAIYQWSTVPLKDPQGNVIGLTGVGRDITERKHIEEALAKVAAEQKNIMETVSDGVYMLDMNGNLVSWNREVDEVTGLSAEELMDKPIVEFFAEEDRAAVAEAITKGLEEGTGEVTGSFLRKDRPPAIYQWSTVPLKDPQGNVIGLTGVGRDITERKEMEKKIKKRNEQLGMTNLDLNSMNRELTATNEELLSTQDELKESRRSIEWQNVKLEKKIDELERYKKVTVGRELKMIELKKRMKELEENKMNRR